MLDVTPKLHAVRCHDDDHAALWLEFVETRSGGVDGPEDPRGARRTHVEARLRRQAGAKRYDDIVQVLRELGDGRSDR